MLTFVVIGGGPTGTELAGAFAELSRFALTNDFRSIVPQEARVILLEGGPRILAAFDPRSSERAARQLESLGVIVRTGASVKSVDAHGVEVNGERIDAATVVWAAGVETSPLARSLGAPLDSQGRVVVGRDLSLPGYPDVFVIGDMCSFEQDGARLPGLSPVAIQQGRFAARAIRASLDGGPRGEFRYNDRGKMATVGRSRAVAETHGMRLTGFVAWMVWLLVHLWFLIGFRSRLIVMFEWFWSYATYGRGARLITGRAAAQPDPPSSFQSPP